MKKTLRSVLQKPRTKKNVSAYLSWSKIIITLQKYKISLMFASKWLKMIIFAAKIRQNDHDFIRM